MNNFNTKLFNVIFILLLTACFTFAFQRTALTADELTFTDADAKAMKSDDPDAVAQSIRTAVNLSFTVSAGRTMPGPGGRVKTTSGIKQPLLST